MFNGCFSSKVVCWLLSCTSLKDASQSCGGLSFFLGHLISSFAIVISLWCSLYRPLGSTVRQVQVNPWQSFHPRGPNLVLWEGSVPPALIPNTLIPSYLSQLFSSHPHQPDKVRTSFHSLMCAWVRPSFSRVLKCWNISLNSLAPLKTVLYSFTPFFPSY